MGIAMASLTRTKTGLWAARKAIPADVRKAYGKWEVKKTWPAALSQGQAKAELATWLAEIEERITLLRAQASQTPITLSKRQARALAGEWYKAKKAEYEENPGHPANWEISWDDLVPDDPQEREEGRVRPTEWLIKERDAFLASKAMLVQPNSTEDLLQEMGDLWIELCQLMERRARGDYGPDPLVETLPLLEAAPSKPKAAVSIMGLFEDYAKTGQLAPHTESKWRGVMKSFVAHVGHDDATKVSRADAHSWFAALIAKGLRLAFSR